MDIIRKYGEDFQYIHWPLVSVYHQILRDGAACFHLSTSYKYTRLLHMQRFLPAHRRKNHATGIRASAPLKLLHADVTFSNSMIEAANKNIKYRFLYHQSIADHQDLCKYVSLAVEDFNNRPHDVLAGLTPLEVLKGKTVNNVSIHQKMMLAKATRIDENKKVSCCNIIF